MEIGGLQKDQPVRRLFERFFGLNNLDLIVEDTGMKLTNSDVLIHVYCWVRAVRTISKQRMEDLTGLDSSLNV